MILQPDYIICFNICQQFCNIFTLVFSSDAISEIFDKKECTGAVASRNTIHKPPDDERWLKHMRFFSRELLTAHRQRV